MRIDFSEILRETVVVNCETRDEEIAFLKAATESQLFSGFSSTINFWKTHKERTCHDLSNYRFDDISSFHNRKIVKFSNLDNAKIIII